MQAATTPDGTLNLRLEPAEADRLRRSLKTAISAMVTLYAREGMTDAKNFLASLQLAASDASFATGNIYGSGGGTGQP